MFFVPHCRHANGIFFTQRMNGAAFRSADLSVLTFGRLLVCMGWSRKIEGGKLSTGQALQHHQGKEGIEDCRIGYSGRCFQIRMAKNYAKCSKRDSPGGDLRCIAEVAALCHRQAPFQNLAWLKYSRGFSVFLDSTRISPYEWSDLAFTRLANFRPAAHVPVR